MKTTYLIILVLGTAGCATTSTTYAPDGREGYTLNCSGTARSWSMCLKAAGDACGAAGYDVIDRAEGGGGERTMMVACAK